MDSPKCCGAEMVETQGIYLDWNTAVWECLVCSRIATEDELDEDEEWTHYA